MNKEDIIDMARQAGWTEYSLRHFVEVDRLERFFHLAVAAEREACASLCEDEAERWEGDDGPISTEARLCAIRIRERGEK